MSARPLSGRHVLAMAIGFLAVVVAVNAIFVVLALSTWSGLSTANAYREGLAYNETLRAAAAQQESGWRLAVDAALRPGNVAALEVAVRDRDDAPVDGLVVAVEFRRPTHQGIDRRAVLDHRGGGRYTGAVALPAAGQWDLVVVATSGTERRFRREQRLWLK